MSGFYLVHFFPKLSCHFSSSLIDIRSIASYELVVSEENLSVDNGCIYTATSHSPDKVSRSILSDKRCRIVVIQENDIGRISFFNLSTFDSSAELRFYKSVSSVQDYKEGLRPRW